MASGVFVTGTDTGVGKTVVSAALVCLHRRRSPVCYWKPIQTGIEQDDDTAEVARLAGCTAAEVLDDGIRLERPLSPHRSAALAGRTIRIEDVVRPLEGRLKAAPAATGHLKVAPTETGHLKVAPTPTDHLKVAPTATGRLKPAPTHGANVGAAFRQPADVLDVGAAFRRPASGVLNVGAGFSRPASSGRLAAAGGDPELPAGPDDHDPFWIVEGAGGVLVPLNDDELMIDLIATLGLPAVVVARTAVGTINHTLLTIDALRRRGIAIAAIVMSGVPEPAARDAIEHHREVQVADFPLLDPLDPATLQTWARHASASWPI